MPLYLYQFSYTADSWAAQIKNPQDRIETVARPVVEKAGGKLVGGWMTFGDHDIAMIIDVPTAEAMAGIAIAVAAGGGAKGGRTTQLMTGAQGVDALKAAGGVAQGYKAAR